MVEVVIPVAPRRRFESLSCQAAIFVACFVKKVGKSGMPDERGTLKCALDNAPVERKYVPVSSVARAGAQSAWCRTHSQSADLRGQCDPDWASSKLDFELSRVCHPFGPSQALGRNPILALSIADSVFLRRGTMLNRASDLLQLRFEIQKAIRREAYPRHQLRSP